MVKIFADGADKASILELNKNPLIKGFTTNPSLLRKAGVTNYKEFALNILSVINDKPFSFEIISDDFDEMFEQAIYISKWGKNVFVKIPIVNTKGVLQSMLINELSDLGLNLNITAITTIEQLKIVKSLSHGQKHYISIFAGRIADTGVDPTYIMLMAKEWVKNKNIEIIWASPREVFNIYQADLLDIDIITCTPDLISKYEKLKGKDLTEYSKETVQMFFDDATKSGLSL